MKIINPGTEGVYPTKHKGVERGVEAQHKLGVHWGGGGTGLRDGLTRVVSPAANWIC